MFSSTIWMGNSAFFTFVKKKKNEIKKKYTHADNVIDVDDFSSLPLSFVFLLYIYNIFFVQFIHIYSCRWFSNFQVCASLKVMMCESFYFIKYALHLNGSLSKLFTDMNHFVITKISASLNRTKRIEKRHTQTSYHSFIWIEKCLHKFTFTHVNTVIFNAPFIHRIIFVTLFMFAWYDLMEKNKERKKYDRKCVIFNVVVEFPPFFPENPNSNKQNTKPGMVWKKRMTERRQKMRNLFWKEKKTEPNEWTPVKSKQCNKFCPHHEFSFEL